MTDIDKIQPIPIQEGYQPKPGSVTRQKGYQPQPTGSAPEPSSPKPPSGGTAIQPPPSGAGTAASK